MFVTIALYRIDSVIRMATVDHKHHPPQIFNTLLMSLRNEALSSCRLLALHVRVCYFLIRTNNIHVCRPRLHSEKVFICTLWMVQSNSQNAFICVLPISYFKLQKAFRSILYVYFSYSLTSLVSSMYVSYKLTKRLHKYILHIHLNSQHP